MPEQLAAYLVRETGSNVKDVRAAFRESYSTDTLRALQMPVVAIVGDRSPAITHLIARVLSERVSSGSLRSLEKATHAMITTHPDAVAEAIAGARLVIGKG
jgi:pimeloyl-ACP methyl ester carboxylesterase